MTGDVSLTAYIKTVHTALKGINKPKQCVYVLHLCIACLSFALMGNKACMHDD